MAATDVKVNTPAHFEPPPIDRPAYFLSNNGRSEMIASD